MVKSSNALVFINHDTRDAKLAEAFSALLKSVSAGVLKSLRTSDKKGNQRIEYGVEWYPEIIRNIQEASDVGKRCIKDVLFNRHLICQTAIFVHYSDHDAVKANNQHATTVAATRYTDAKKRLYNYVKDERTLYCTCKTRPEKRDFLTDNCGYIPKNISVLYSCHYSLKKGAIF